MPWPRAWRTRGAGQIGIAATFFLAVLLLGASAGLGQQVHIVPRVPVEPQPSAPPPAAPNTSSGTVPNSGRSPGARAGAGAAPGSAAPAGARAPAAPVTFTANTDLVLVPVTVTDPDDRLVTGLEADQFRVYEDKASQVIRSFSTDDAPISVGVVFDSSGSMADKIAKSRQALSQFFKTANPRDEFFLVDFADEPRLICRFTSNIDQLENAIDFVPAHGRTALLDAIYLGLDEMRAAHNSRKALLIISDGGDNNSRYTETEIRNVVRESDVQIFAIGIFSPVGERGTPEEESGPSLLSDISTETGGRMFPIDDVDELPDVATKIGEELRNEYIIGYRPANQAHDGKWRKIRVKLDPPPGLPPLTVAARAGYYAPAH